MNPQPRSLKQAKSEWKARLGNNRVNGGRQGRQTDSRAGKREKRAGRGNP